MIKKFTVENKYHLDVLACAYAEYFGKTKPQESIKRMFGRPPGLWSGRNRNRSQTGSGFCNL